MKINCSKFVKYEKKSKKFLFFGEEKIEQLIGLEIKKGYIYKWKSFNEFEKTETKIPEHYEKIKLNKKIINLLYCDNSKSLLEKNNDFYKTIKIKHKNDKTYFIHNNYERKFLIYVNKNKIYIYSFSKKFYINENDWSKNDNKNKWMYIDLIKEYKYKNIFIGKSNLNELTKNSKGYGKHFDGNTLLLQLNKNHYLFIGYEIYEFKTNEPIIEYYSSVGNNDLPYPVAFSNKNIYFMLDKKYASINDFIKILNNNKLNDKIKETAYLYYYGYDDDIEPLSNYDKKFKYIKIIHK